MHQESILIYIGLAGLGAVLFFMLGYFIRKRYATRKLKNAEERAKRALENAASEAEKIRHGAELEAKDLLLKMRTEFEQESKGRRQELNVLEKRLMQKEENLDRKVDIIDRKEKDIERRDLSLVEREKQMHAKEKSLDAMIQEEKEKLQRVSGMTKDEARQVLLRRLEDEVKKAIFKLEDKELITTDIGENLQTASAEDTQIIVALDERFPAIYRQLSVFVRERHFSNPYIVNKFLQFTLLIGGTANATLGDGNMAQADIVRSAALPAMAGKTGVGMLSQDKLQEVPP